MCDFPKRTEDVKVHQLKFMVHVAAGCDIFNYVKATDGCLRAVLKLPPGMCFAGELFNDCKQVENLSDCQCENLFPFDF